MAACINVPVLHLKFHIVMIKSGVICEDAIMKTTNDHVKAIEAAVNQVNELMKQAAELTKQYEKIRIQLQQYEEELLPLKNEIEELKKKFDEQAATNVSEELSESKTQIKTSNEKMSKVEINIALSKKKLQEIIDSIASCDIQLVKSQETLMKCNKELEHHSTALDQEHLIRLQRAADQISTAKKWGIGGALAMFGGVGTAALALVSGELITEFRINKCMHITLHES